ncbi:MAG: hypothetical protein JOZ41_19600 [Chloroflexi bacterium]|nr:hypothetical protein [Chloroflexota bacterium]
MDLLQESIALARQHQISDEIVRGLIDLGWVTHESGEEGQAAEVFIEGLGLAVKPTPAWAAASALEGLASISTNHRRLQTAAQLFSVANRLRATSGVPVRAIDRPCVERQLALVRSILGEEHFEIAWQQGQAMTVEETVAAASTGLETSGVVDSPRG